MATVSLRTSRASFTLAHLDEQITAVFFYFVAAGLERRKLIQITVRVLMDSPAPNPDLGAAHGEEQEHSNRNHENDCYHSQRLIGRECGTGGCGTRKRQQGADECVRPYTSL